MKHLIVHVAQTIDQKNWSLQIFTEDPLMVEKEEVVEKEMTQKEKEAIFQTLKLLEEEIMMELVV